MIYFSASPIPDEAFDSREKSGRGVYMRILIIGAVAAGTSAAAKASRDDRDAEIVVYEKGDYISYSACGMPYYIGGEIDNLNTLVPRDPIYFKNTYGVEVKTAHEVTELDSAGRTVQVRNILTGDVFSDSYDRLVIASGAKAAAPPIKGLGGEHIFTLRTMDDGIRIRKFIADRNPSSAVIIGGGSVGLELCESLRRLQMDITVVERSSQIAGGLDEDMAAPVRVQLEEYGIRVLVSAAVKEIGGGGVLLADGTQIRGDMIFLVTGVRPEVSLAEKAGIELGPTGAIKVDKMLRTGVKEIYACGDCMEQYHMVTGDPVYFPLGSTANKTGRIAGENVTGGNALFRGVLGTGIFRICDLTVAQTGLTERDAKARNCETVVSHNTDSGKSGYFGGRPMTVKTVADRKTGRILGAQIVGYDGVDKRIDIMATAIAFGAKAGDLENLDLAYSPPFSTPRDPVMYAGMILGKKLPKN